MASEIQGPARPFVPDRDAIRQTITAIFEKKVQPQDQDSLSTALRTDCAQFSSLSSGNRSVANITQYPAIWQFVRKSLQEPAIPVKNISNSKAGIESGTSELPSTEGRGGQITNVVLQPKQFTRLQQEFKELSGLTATFFKDVSSLSESNISDGDRGTDFSRKFNEFASFVTSSNTDIDNALACNPPTGYEYHKGDKTNNLLSSCDALVSDIVDFTVLLCSDQRAFDFSPEIFSDILKHASPEKKNEAFMAILEKFLESGNDSLPQLYEIFSSILSQLSAREIIDIMVVLDEREDAHYKTLFDPEISEGRVLNETQLILQACYIIANNVTDRIDEAYVKLTELKNLQGFDLLDLKIAQCDNQSDKDELLVQQLIQDLGPKLDSCSSEEVVEIFPKFIPYFNKLRELLELLETTGKFEDCVTKPVELTVTILLDSIKGGIKGANYTLLNEVCDFLPLRLFEGEKEAVKKCLDGYSEEDLVVIHNALLIFKERPSLGEILTICKDALIASRRQE